MPALDLLDAWARGRRLTRQVVEAIPEHGWTFRPVPGVFSCAEQLVHIVATEQTLVEALETGTWRWDRGIEPRRHANRIAMLDLLDGQTAATRVFLHGLYAAGWERPISVPWGGQATVAELLNEWMLHEAHHRGQLYTYLRLLGIKPPEYT